jgi:hypothetical protein
VTGGRGRVLFKLEGEEMLYWDWIERNRYNWTGERDIVILGLQGKEQL